MTFYISVEMQDTVCCVGGYALDQFDHETGTRISFGRSMMAMRMILETVGVRNWEDLPGKFIRVEHNGLGSSITRIGNIIEEKWVDLKEFFSRG